MWLLPLGESLTEEDSTQMYAFSCISTSEAALTFVSMVTSPSEAMATTAFQLLILRICWRVLTLNSLLEKRQFAKVF